MVGFPEELLDDDATIEIEGVSWSGSSLRLDLKLLSDGTRWLIACTSVSRWCVQDRFAEGLRISDDDAVLWISQFAIHTTYFAGKPIDPHRAAGDLLSAIPKRSDVLDFSPNRLAALLETGSGSLGSLPVPAFRLCEAVLRNHGVHLYHLGFDESRTSTASTALLFGSGSFVIAERFDAEPMPDRTGQFPVDKRARAAG